MKTHHARRGALTLVAAVAALLMFAAPASATVHNLDMVMDTGRITVGGIAFDTPGSGISGCPSGTTTITGTVDDVTNVATTNLSITAPFQNGLVGNNYLQATGSGVGTYNPVTKQANITIAITFTIRSYTGAPTCAPGAIKCGGTAHLNVTVQFPATFPPMNTGDVATVNSTSGSILTTSPACSGFLGLIVRPGASLSISANPTLSPVPAGAEFRQL